MGIREFFSFFLSIGIYARFRSSPVIARGASAAVICCTELRFLVVYTNLQGKWNVSVLAYTLQLIELVPIPAKRRNGTFVFSVAANHIHELLVLLVLRFLDFDRYSSGRRRVWFFSIVFGSSEKLIGRRDDSVDKLHIRVILRFCGNCEQHRLREQKSRDERGDCCYLFYGYYHRKVLVLNPRRFLSPWFLGFLIFGLRFLRHGTLWSGGTFADRGFYRFPKAY